MLESFPNLSETFGITSLPLLKDALLPLNVARSFFHIANRNVGGYAGRFYFSGANYRDQRAGNLAQR